MAKKNIADVTRSLGTFTGLGLPGMSSPASTARPRVTVRVATDEVLTKSDTDQQPPKSFAKSLLNLLDGEAGSVERLAFETDPSYNNQFQTVYRAKVRGVPDAILKRIAIQDDLVAAVVRAREVQMSTFGRPRPDRFSNGYVIEPKAGVVDKMTPQQKAEMDRRIEAAIDLFNTCGSTDKVPRLERMTFSQFLMQTARNAVVVGRIAVEIVRTDDIKTGVKRFHSFRPVDAGTIYFATPQKHSEDAIRENAQHLLAQIKNKKVKKKPVPKKEYAYVQVIENTPREVFTEDELVVHNFYPVLDVEMHGYPVTPLDTAITAVTTHINITTHNKMYFQTGRASRGMLVFKSDDVDENMLNRIKQQFQASINSVNNAWRMPVFSVGKDDDITWEAIDNSSRDAEFQYLTDMNARVILSAFQMSPDELPGWSYLSRGTNNQSLSESNNEYRLEAARDLGIRPLIAAFEDFINQVLFPLIDEGLAKQCRFKLKGLDADTEEKESIRIQQDMAVHMTYDEIMYKVEKKPIGPAMGGGFPLNPQIQTIFDKYFTVGQVQEFFFGVKDASKDPAVAYFRDPFWFNFQQLQLQKAQAAAQAQQQQAQAQQQAAGGGAPNSDQQEGSGVSDDQAPDQGGGAQTEDQKSDQAQQGAPSAPQADLSRSVDQAMEVLTKSEAQLPRSKRKLLALHRRTLDGFRSGLEDEMRAATSEILRIARRHVKE